MVHLTTRFAVLAVASLVALNSVDAIALPAHPSQPAIASGTTSRSEARALPLPLQVQRRKKGGQKHKVEKEYRQRHEDAQFARHANQVFFQRGRSSRRSIRRDHGNIIVNGEDDHIHIVDHDNRHHWADKIIVNGVGEHIHIKDRRSSSLVSAPNANGLVSHPLGDLPRRGSVADEDSVESGSTLSARDAGQTENVMLVSISSGPEGDSQSAQEDEEEEEEEDFSSTLATVTETVTSTMTAPSNDPTTIAAEDREDSSSTLATITETVTSTVTASSNDPTATAAEGQSAQDEEDSSSTLVTVTETVTSTVTAPSNDPTANAAQDTSESEDASTSIDPSSSSTTPVNAMKVEVFDSSL